MRVHSGDTRTELVASPKPRWEELRYVAGFSANACMHDAPFPHTFIPTHGDQTEQTTKDAHYTLVFDSMCRRASVESAFTLT